MKRVFENAECEAVRNSIFLVQRYKKHKNQMKGCAVELKVSDLYRVGQKKVSLIIFAITLSTPSQFS